MPDLGICRGEVDGSLRGRRPGEEFVRFLIGISMGGDSADEGEELGLRNAGGCASGEAGDAGDVE